VITKPTVMMKFLDLIKIMMKKVKELSWFQLKVWTHWLITGCYWSRFPPITIDLIHLFTAAAMLNWKRWTD